LNNFEPDVTELKAFSFRWPRGVKWKIDHPSTTTGLQRGRI